MYDEFDILFDMLKLKIGGGYGGYNGVCDVVWVLGMVDFLWVCVGIGCFLGC